MNYFEGWEKFNVDGASVPFYKTIKNGVSFVGFDCRECMPPEPMVNASIALNFAKDENTKIVMINHRFPAGLIPKIESRFDYVNEELESGFRLEFTLKNGAKPDKNMDVTCNGVSSEH